jgi:hypothetical protein
MEPSARQTSAAELLADTRSRLADVEQTIRSHRFLEALAQRRVPEEHLRALAGEQWTIIASDRRAFAMLASRFPSHLAGDFFLSMAQGEGQALSLLRSYPRGSDWTRRHSTPTSRGPGARPTRPMSPGSR